MDRKYRIRKLECQRKGHIELYSDIKLRITTTAKRATRFEFMSSFYLLMCRFRITLSVPILLLLLLLLLIIIIIIIIINSI
jgi:hypothetical protein